MHNNYWSLIVFTLLSQFSVGVMFYMTAVHLFQNPSFQSLSTGFSLKSPEFIVIITTVLAIIVSLFHLGSPLHAPNALNNLKSSWLSREILGISLFAFGVFLVFLARMIGPPNSWGISASLVIASIAGIALLVFMSKIYMIPTIPGWNTWYTPTSFLLTALALGGLGLVGFIFIQPGSIETLPSSFIQKIAIVVSVVLLIQLITAYFHQSGLVRLETLGIDQKSFADGGYHTLYLVRMFLLVVCILFTAYFSIRTPALIENFHSMYKFYFSIFALVVIQEIIGRSMFYESYFRVGV